eukprot:TRINITY_DN3228_c0_g1_i5.p4 TRINITY_DN3228_c0_g1~~TRINITY_DN3228_c0_g1_i5.p4  ORF type:complete len:206 (-),score=-38.80 TRINITY_DN3228_c0_g1_i5:4-621(-)
MGEPTQGNAWVPHIEHIDVTEGTGGTETSKYPKEERTFPEQWRAKGEEPKPDLCNSVQALQAGVVSTGGAATQARKSYKKLELSGNALGRRTGEGESPVHEKLESLVGQLEYHGARQSCGKQGGPTPKAKYFWRPIVDQYREGKVKRTGVTGVKQNLKPCAYKQWEGYGLSQDKQSLTACLLEPASYSLWRGQGSVHPEPQRKRV